MVDTPWAHEAAALAEKHPSLGVGLHFVATDQSGPLFDLNKPRILRAQLDRQYEAFCALLGRPPTHVDSHQHVHFEPDSLNALFFAWAGEHRITLRRSGEVHFNGGFYGHTFDEQWLHTLHRS